jgi:hypothetical protein
MGLSIHYTIRASRLDFTQAKALTRTLRREAQSMQRRGEVEQVLTTTTELAELTRWAVSWKILPDPTDPHTSTGVAVEPLEGCIFPVEIGEGCEPLWLGLCRYPATVTHNGSTMATKLGSGWQFRGSCKTQYASVHGWDHFHRCHTSVIALLRLWSGSGARVRIVDEGEWWPKRSDTTLRRKVDEMNGIVAAVAGAVKDAIDDNSPSTPIVSPIFSHPHFERLEAEGLARKGSAVADALRLISSQQPPR